MSALFRHALPLVALLALAAPALARDDGLPPRAQWKASSSSAENPAMAAAFAIDGNPATRWGGGFSAGHWFQLDLGRSASIGAVEIRWEWAGAPAYSIQVSEDGEHWRTAYETTDGSGGVEYDVFPAVRARYLRLAAPARSASWGVSVFEFRPYAVDEAPRIASADAEDATLWLGAAPRARPAQAGSPGARELRIDLPRPLPVAGLQVWWGETPKSARLEARDAAGNWSLLGDDPEAWGRTSFLAADAPREVAALRLHVDANDTAPSIERLRLLGPTQALTPMKRYQIAAARQHAALFPSSLHDEQVYWTAVGIPAGRQKAVFDEYGNLEAFKGAPLVQPLWRDGSGQATAATSRTRIEHRLREGWMPMPGLRWSPRPGLELDSEAIAIERDGLPVVLVRHRLRNVGKDAVEGAFSLLTRPIQVSPPWQNGGLSPIRDIAVEGDAVRVNGRILYRAGQAADAGGASAFGAHGEDEITHHAAAGTAPPQAQARDDLGLGAALQGWRVRLAPGAHRDFVLAFALGGERIDPDQPPPQAPTPALPAPLDGAAFDRLADEAARQWQARLGRICLSLPDRSLVDMLRAQAAYMLINQSGPAMQPGPRNYNRSFIRDGAATAAILLRTGMAKTAHDYLEWYAAHAVHEDGLVSPILNDDGTVNTGFGSDLEYDSQGEFVWLVAETARLDGGAESVRAHRQQVTRALRFLQQLRERTLADGYLRERPAPERFRGLVAPSISHEGYPVPTHSYWDDWWALKGWHDGAWLLQKWGDAAGAQWAREQYAALRESLAASIRATMRWKGADFIPASADLGDGDPTSVSIGLDPTGQQDTMPADALRRTFARYLDDVRGRDAPDALYAYTPYEMRNVLTYVHLDQPQAANELLTRLLGDRRPAEWQVLAEVVYSDPRHAIYLGDMPHTWIGAEYARAIFGMLMHEGDDALELLPGAPMAWTDGGGIAIDGLPTAYGPLTLRARQRGSELRIELGAGLRGDAALQVHWPNRRRPAAVTIDGKTTANFDAEGIRTAKPFRRLTARW
ncbi:MAG: discoidin domain-containing protein [Pseudoxanthomonas sp.]